MDHNPTSDQTQPRPPGPAPLCPVSMEVIAHHAVDLCGRVGDAVADETPSLRRVEELCRELEQFRTVLASAEPGSHGLSEVMAARDALQDARAAVDAALDRVPD